MFLLPRISRRLGVFLSVLLAASATGVASTVSSPRGRDWLQQYYQNPTPERFVPSIYEMTRTRYFALPGQAMVGIGFMASLFQANPGRVDEWLLYCRRLPEEECRMVVAALWYAGYPKGEEYLQMHAELARDENLRALLDRILATSPSLAELPIDSKSALYLCWGRFLATGDEAILRRIFTAIPRLEKLTVRDQWWLACAMARHEMAVNWCRRELAQEPADMRASLELVLAAADARLVASK